MSKATEVEATLLDTYDNRKLSSTPGAYYFVLNDDRDEVGIVHSCPCGCGIFSGAYFAPSTQKVLWTRSGMRDKLTLRPSIGIWPPHKDTPVESDGYHWHGHLTAGVWRSV